MLNLAKMKAHLSVEIITKFNAMDLKDITDATISTMNKTQGFNIGTQTIDPLQEDLIVSYWRGAMLVPERTIIVGRIDGVIGGAVQILVPGASNQTSSFSCFFDNLFTATWARGYGLSSIMLDLAEKEANAMGKTVVRISVRETRDLAIKLFEKRGYIKWGYLPKYELDNAKIVGGYFYYKEL